jgi:ABC-type dipeptide/oligopeptide/nickel transport system permease component
MDARRSPAAASQLSTRGTPVLSYAVRRLLWIIPVLLVATMVTFLVMHNTPGSPWNSEGRQMPSEQRDYLNQKFGLDKPLAVQYVNWLGSLLTGNLGISYRSSIPFGTPGDEVADSLGRSLLPTLQLGLMAFALAVLLGVPLGLIAAIRHGTLYGYAATGLAMIGMAAPAFMLGALLQLFIGAPEFRPQDGLFPSFGWDGPRSWVLPTIALAGLPMATIARQTKASMLDVIDADYVRTAHSKGLEERHIIQFHMIRNALVPLLTVAVPLLGLVITSSIVVEQVFRIPGIGALYWTAIRFRDYTTVMAITVVFASVVAILNALVDIAYGFIDPRLRDSAVSI